MAGREPRELFFPPNRWRFRKPGNKFYIGKPGEPDNVVRARVASVTTFDRDGVPKSYVPYDPNDPRSIANANAQVRGLLNTPLPHTRDEMLSALTKGGYIVYDPTRDVTHTIPLARPDAVPGGPDAPCRYCGLGRSEHHEVTDRDERFGLYTTRLVGGDGAPAGVPIHPYEP